MKGIENFITFIRSCCVCTKRDTFKKLTNIVILASIIGILIITIIKPDIKVTSATKLFTCPFSNIYNSYESVIRA